MRDNDTITYFENNNALWHFHVQLCAFFRTANEHWYDDCHIRFRFDSSGTVLCVDW